MTQEGRLVGPYRLDAQIGAGGMGTVWLATVEGAVPGVPVGEHVAVKIVHPDLAVDADVFERFVREASLGRSIRHENVVRTLDAGMDVTDDGLLVYLAMERVVGRTLAALRDASGPAPDGFCRRIAREVARGLRAIHERGVVHGDVKPENVLLTRDEVVKVMDLGLARLRDGSLRRAESGRFSGSLLYAAPEQFGPQQGGVDGRVDLFALGATVYELAAGRHPWFRPGEAFVPRQVEVDPAPLREVRPDASEFLEAVVHALLARDPARRIRSASELASILSAAEDGPWFRAWRARRAGRPAGSPVLGGSHDRARIHGRESELAELWGLLRAACGGRGGGAVVEGAPGSGKTRLGETLAETASAARLDVVLERHVLAAGGELPAHDAVGGGAPTTTRIVLVEGAETASDAAWDALSARLRRASSGQDLVVVTTAEPLSLARAESVGEATVRLTLGPLSDAALEDLAADLLLAGRASPALVRALAERSGGNAGVAAAWLGSLLAAGAIRAAPDGRWLLVAPGDRTAAPDEVLAWGARSLAAVPPDDRELLEVCACAGTAFDTGVVAACTGTTPRQVEGRLGVLSRRGIVRRLRGDRWEFGARAVVAALLGGLSESLREEYVRLLFDARKSSTPRGPEESADLLRCAAQAGSADVPIDDVRVGLAALEDRGREEDVVAIADALLRAGADAELAAEIRLRRASALLGLGLVDEARAALRSVPRTRGKR